ncbi:hypothetical protein K501DRAFT_271071 [Backusella circina FSU 941]|nr:hypothetical protein K501DRAFT_271071 [Backusella circina FSU 941]
MFIDESGFKVGMMPRRARAPKRNKTYIKTKVKRGVNITIIEAMAVDHMLGHHSHSSSFYFILNCDHSVVFKAIWEHRINTHISLATLRENSEPIDLEIILSDKLINYIVVQDLLLSVKDQVGISIVDDIVILRMTITVKYDDIRSVFLEPIFA